MKVRVSEGMGVVKQTENLTTNDENELWEKGVFKGFKLWCVFL